MLELFGLQLSGATPSSWRKPHSSMGNTSTTTTTTLTRSGMDTTHTLSEPRRTSYSWGHLERWFSPPGRIWGSQVWGSDSHQASTWEDELKKRHTGTKERVKSTKTSWSQRTWQSLNPAAPEPALSLNRSFTWASVSLLWMVGLDVLSLASERIQRCQAIFIQGQKPILFLILFVRQIP